MMLNANALKHWHQRRQVPEETHCRSHGRDDTCHMCSGFAISRPIKGFILERKRLQSLGRLGKELREDHLPNGIWAEGGRLCKGLLHQLNVTLINGVGDNNGRSVEAHRVCRVPVLITPDCSTSLRSTSPHTHYSGVDLQPGILDRLS